MKQTVSIYSCVSNFGTYNAKTLCIVSIRASLSPLAPNAPHKLHVLREDGDAFAMNSTEVSIFEQTGETSLGGSLAGHYSLRLEAKVSFEVLCYFPNQALEGHLAYEQLGRLLVLADLSIYIQIHIMSR